jgi:hypothetical protein
MKRTALVLTLILALLFSAVAGTQLANLAAADFIPLPAEPNTTPPTISILSPEYNKSYNVNNVSLTFIVKAPPSWNYSYNMNNVSLSTIICEITGVSYSMDEKESVDITQSMVPDLPGSKTILNYSGTVTELSEEIHTLAVTVRSSSFYRPPNYPPGAYETSGLVTHENVSFTVDTTLPVISVLSLENKTYNIRDIPLNLKVNESVSQITYSLDGQKNVTITGNTTLTDLPDGEHNLTVYASDSAGNIGVSETIYFSVKVPFPTTLVVASIVLVAVIGAGLLVYFKKRNNTRINKHSEIEQPSI